MNPNRLPGDGERTTAETRKLDQPVDQEGPRANLAGSRTARPGTERERLDYGFRSVTSRQPTSEERGLLADALRVQLQHFAATPEEAEKVIANGESKPRTKLPIPEFAAWTMVANLMLNLDETVTRN